MAEAWFTARHKSFNEIKTWEEYFFHKCIIQNQFCSKPFQYYSFLIEKYHKISSK